MVANHGQRTKYVHEMIGCNSRLDTLQAAILDVKLNYLDEYEHKRYAVAQKYHAAFKEAQNIACPKEESYTTHVFHQYTLKVIDGRRNALKEQLSAAGIPSMVYYPLPLHQQQAFKNVIRQAGSLEESERLCSQALSLPIHTQMQEEVQQYIIEKVLETL